MRKYIVVLTIAIIALMVWIYTAVFAYINYHNIKMQLVHMVDPLLVPYRMAVLQAQPADTALPVPVEGVRMRQIADTWGDARSGGRTHEGVDIFAKRGTPVYSATEGYVVRIGTNRLGGNVIYILGAGGRRYYYAHLHAVSPALSVGDRVSTTTVIGLVGNTGNASGTSPHLHFGMYQFGAQNPYPLLIDRI
jgi:peptidoglycan LD-endopeptidase LytH